MKTCEIQTDMGLIAGLPVLRENARFAKTPSLFLIFVVKAC